MTEKVAIVIPCYNQGPFLLEAVESALAQSYAPIEIVVVDDGSNRETREVCESISDSKAKVIRHPENRGLSAARNSAIRASTAPYILPLDADDLLHPEFVEATLPVLQAKAEVGWVYTDTEFFGVREGFLDFPDYSLTLLLAHDLCLAPSLFRRSHWERVGGYDESFREGQEDWDLWLCFVELGLVGERFSRRLHCYRQHEDSLRIRSHRHIQVSGRQVWKKHSKLFQQHAYEIWNYYLGRFYGGIPDPFKSVSSRSRVKRWLRNLGGFLGKSVERP